MRNLSDDSRRLPVPANANANGNGNGNGSRVASAEILSHSAIEPPMQLLEAGSGSGLVEYWRIVVRHKATVILLFVIGALVGFLYTLPQTPIYHASATLEVQGLNEDFLNLKDVTPTSTGIALDPAADILTQVKLLQSQSLRQHAITKLRAKPSPLSARSTPGDRVQVWKQALHLNSGPILTWDGALDMAAGSLTVRASGTTRIMEISADSADPKAAADFVNGLTTEFIDQDLEGRMTSSEVTSQWLTRQLDDLKIKLEKSEDQVQAYASSAGLQMAGGGVSGKDDHADNVTTAKLRALQTELLSAQADRVKTQSKYELVSSAPIDSLPEVVDDANLREYQTKLADLRRQIAEAKVSFTPVNPKVVKLQTQIDEVERAFRKERQDVVSRIKNDYDASMRREKLIETQYDAHLKLVNDQSSQAIHYDILKREADTNHQIYEAMLQKVKEASIAAAMRSSNYKIIDPANPPSAPYKPNLSQSSMMGSLGGLVLGVLFVLVRERADRSLQQPGDVAHFLNLPELGVIPSDRAGSAAKLYGGRKGLIPAQATDQDVALATFHRRPSLLAESFHDTLTSILFSGHNDFQPQVIALTSAGPAEGKTTISSNLAAALADINQKVLLIDADMRRPRQHAVFGLPNVQGLSSLLKDHSPILGCPPAPIVMETLVPGLSVMPSGPAVSNAANLLYSPRLAEMIRAIRSEFDFILIDTPPMLQIADARIIGQHCDSVILVVRAGKTTRDTARAAKLKFQQDGTPILGSILNDWIPGQNGYGYDAKYYDRYAKYYSGRKEKD
jgi:capsular exopolysaccharide synthesis family protein